MAHALPPIGNDRLVASCRALSISNALFLSHANMPSHGDAQNPKKWIYNVTEEVTHPKICDLDSREGEK